MNHSDPRPSKTQQKKEANNIQKLGAYLSTLSEKKLNEISMPNNIRSAITEIKKISSNSARRRQQQYIGRLLRSIDHKSIKLQIDKLLDTQTFHKSRHKLILHYRDELVTKKIKVDDFCEHYSEANSEQLIELVHNASHSNSEKIRKTNYKLIFKYLESTIDQDKKDE